jgi:hypothetical protein
VLLKGVRGKWGKSPSSSRQVFDYYNSPKLGAYEAIVKEVDRIGSADLSQDDILNPKGWVLVSYTLDPRFIAEHAYGTLLIESLREGKNAESIIALPAVQKRIERYQRDEKRYAEVLKQFSRVDGNVIVTDFRQCQDIPFGNRFFIFTQFPQANVHIRIDPVDILREKMSVGKSVINRSLKLDVGKLMEEFGGGGMEGAGTCFLGKKTADTRIQQIVDRLKA